MTLKPPLKGKHDEHDAGDKDDKEGGDKEGQDKDEDTEGIEDKGEEEYYDDFLMDSSMFFDEVEPMEDLQYYRESPTAKGRAGRKPNPGGPEAPNLEGMDEDQVATAMNLYRKARKAFNDRSLHRQSRISVGGDDDAPDDVIEYTGDCTDKLRMMTEVESFPMMVGHTYPSQVIVRLRLAEEANLCECLMSVHKSDARKVIASGMKDNNSFCIKVLYSSSKAWTVMKCDTSPIPLPKDDAGLALVELGGEEGIADAEVDKKGNNSCSIIHLFFCNDVSNINVVSISIL